MRSGAPVAPDPAEFCRAQNGELDKPSSSQQFILNTYMGTVACSTATFEGTAEAQSEQAQQITNGHSTLTPTLAGCQAFGQQIQILMNGCKFTLTGEAAPAQTATMDVTGCTSGKVVEAKNPICTLTIPEQHNISHVVFSNTPSSSPHDVVAQVTLTGIAYQTHGFLCPNGGGVPTITKSDGTTVGQATVRTREGAGTQLVTEHSHQFNKVKQTGTLVGILAT